MSTIYERFENPDNFVVVHHTDLDGYMAALLVECDKGKTEYVPMNYNYTWDFSKYVGKDVFIVDTSFNESTIENLFKICEIANKVVWIDHHKTSYEAIMNHMIKIKLESYSNLWYLVNTNLCATALVYLINIIGDINIDITNAYREGNIINNNGLIFYMPDNVKYVDSWDRFVWKEEKDMNPVYYNNAFYAMNHKVTYCNNDNFFYTPISKILELGAIIQKSKNADIKRALNNGAMFTIFINEETKLNAWVTNAPSGINPTATLENIYEKYKCDVFIIWRCNNRTHNFSYSVYTRDGIDATVIAKSFEVSGGGHINAAGFTSDKLLFV